MSPRTAGKIGVSQDPVTESMSAPSLNKLSSIRMAAVICDIGVGSGFEELDDRF